MADLKQEDVGLLLGGIESERQKIQARLTWLDNYEREIRNAGVLGTRTRRLGRPKGSKTKGTVKASDKRQISAEHRRKISEAQKKAWANRKKTTGTQPQTPVNVPPAFAETATA